MAELLTLQDLANGHLDVKALGEAANGDENTIVTTRTGNTYPSAERAINIMFKNGGLPATPFATKALMTASALVDGKYAMVTDDTVNNGLYLKTAGAWVKSAYDPLSQSKSYTDTAKQEAIDTAATDAQNKADTAKQGAINAANSYTDIKTEAIERKVKQQGSGEVAISFVSSDDKDLGHINSDGGLVLSGERETLQEQISAVPRNIGEGAALHVSDENGQSLLSIRADGGIMPAGEYESIQEQFVKHAEVSKNRLAYVVASQDYASSRVLFNNIVENDGVEPFKLQTRLSTHDTLPNRAFNRMPAIIRIPSGLLLMYCKRIHPHDGDRRGCKLMQRFVDIDANYRVTNISDEVLIEAPSIDTGVVKHQMLGRAQNNNIVMVYDVREDVDVTYRQYVRISSDEGQTWSEPTEIPQNLDYTRGQTAADSASGTMLVLDSGRLLVPIYSGNKIWLLYSDDNGQTWNHGGNSSGTIDGVFYGVTESGITVDRNGDILFSTRSDVSGVFRKLLYKSTDDGLTIDFYRFADELVSAEVESTILYDPDTDLIMHHTASNTDGRDRTKSRIQVSANNGESFDFAYRPFQEDWYTGYSQLIKYDTGIYMLVYEGDQVFESFNYAEDIGLLTFNLKEVLSNVNYN